MLKKKQPNGQESKKKFFDENMRHGHKKPVFIIFMFADGVFGIIRLNKIFVWDESK